MAKNDKIGGNMNTSRRGFLKIMGIGAGAALVAPTVLADIDFGNADKFINYDGNCEYGNAIPAVLETVMKDPKGLKRTIENILIPDLKRTLPKGSIFEIRTRIPTDFGRTFGIAWYCGPKKKMSNIRNKRLFLELNYKRWQIDRNGGFMVIGRGRV